MAGSDVYDGFDMNDHTLAAGCPCQLMAVVNVYMLHLLLLQCCQHSHHNRSCANSLSSAKHAFGLASIL